MTNATSSLQRPNYRAKYSEALRRFALALTLLTIAGHGFLGFEQSMAQPLVALVAGYSMQLLMEFLYARSSGLRPRYLGGLGQFVDFMLPAHISSLAIAMLLYFNDRLWIVAFASAFSIASKSLLRVPVGNGSRHFFNPSNLALSVTFLLFPSVGVTMPWQWTTGLSGIGDWIFPIAVFCLGFMLHLKYANRIWVVISFLVAFVVQAALRSVFLDVSFLAAVAPLTGVPAITFTFYMIPDPATTPGSRWGQIAFGASVAGVYMLLMLAHIVFALFFSLTLVCLFRGMWMAIVALGAKILPERDRSATVPT